MIKKKLVILLAFIFTAIPMLSAYAASGVFDEAGVLFDTEVTQLETETAELSQLTGWDIVVVTTNDSQNKTSMQYADDYYDNRGYGDNGILFLLDMDNMEIYISTAGEAISYLSDSRIESILNNVAGYASAGSYYKAISTEILMTADYYNVGLPVDQADMASRLAVIIAGIIVGIISAIIFATSVLKSYNFKEIGNIYEYTSKSQMRLTENSDTLVNSFVTTRIRPRQRSSGGGRPSGGSRTHRASSGRVHGGGGRRF